MKTDIVETTKTFEERRGTWTTRIAFYCVAVSLLSLSPALTTLWLTNIVSMISFRLDLRLVMVRINKEELAIGMYHSV
jgi:predicted CDP-diglyceride synthetase/phosphatidate cytidylyltransferase